VQALVARAAQLPEVRQERVHALRQTIESELYHPGSEQVAGAMFEHMIAVPGA
jgi:anti-sigma28 factor (negative regulator of flagellin synthesis)